jgi:type VI protein secretion system component VasF
VQQRLEQHRARANELVRQADIRLVDDPKGARKRLETVRQSIDRQYPGLDQRISSARETEMLRRTERSGGKFWTVVLGVAAAGAVGYLGAQHSLRTTH